ncbi:unnamed protein product [Symbiodinium sp. CCMP2456]|nr:unnamed protein product [Symbiodinium sp. CCMP2456]
MRLDIGHVQEALKTRDSWMEDVSNTLHQIQEREENLTDYIINFKNEMSAKLDDKVEHIAWKEANDALDAALKTVGDMVSSLGVDVDDRLKRDVGELKDLLGNREEVKDTQHESLLCIASAPRCHDRFARISLLRWTLSMRTLMRFVRGLMPLIPSADSV